MGDKEGARVQLDLLLSGKPLEVNAAGRKVRAVYSLRPTRRYRLIILWAPPAQSKYSLEVFRRVRYPVICLLTILFKNELHLRTNAALEALHLDKRV